MRLAPAPAALALALSAFPVWGQIATDGSVGPRTTLTGPRFNIADGLGSRVGRNVIHSFQAFNVRSGESAVFQGPLATDNIVARITGGTASLIDGLVRVEQPGASLFLVNPSGMMFGPGASIDVPGSFYASTAHTLKFADGNAIDMRTAAPVSLTAAPPSAFGFEGPGAAMALSGAQLRARESQRIGLVAGDVAMGASAANRVSLLSAPSGSVSVIATRGAGNVSIEGDVLAPSGFTQMGDLSITGGSGLFVNEGPARRGGGTITVRGGDVTLDHARVESRTRFANGRPIDIGATGRLTVDASNVLAITTGAGNAGSLRLEGRDIAISGGSLVDTSCDPGCTTGRGGALTIVAGNGLTITGSNPLLPTFVVSNSFGGGRTGDITITTGGALTMSGTSFIQAIGLGEGDSSRITLRTGSIALSGGAQVDASARGTGRGGDIDVQNAGAIRIDGTRIDPTQENILLPSGFFSNTAGAGNAGSITIATGSLEVLGGGEVSSTAQAASLGRGGSVGIRATGLVRVAGANGSGKSSGIVANTFSAGDAGTIDISADRLEVADNGRIQTQTEGIGNAGAIRVSARQVALSGGGQVASATFGPGQGGSIDVAATDSVVLSGESGRSIIGIGNVPISATPSGLFTSTSGSGAAGNVTVTAASLQILGGAEISATALADPTLKGIGGSIDIRVSGLVRIAGRGPSGNPAGINANTFTNGNAGRIAITADRVELADGARVQSLSAGLLGDAGEVRVRARAMVVESGANISTQTSRAGRGGTIDLGLSESLAIRGGEGTITFLPADPESPFPPIVVPDTGLFAQTLGSGTGGSVIIDAPAISIDRGTVLGGTFPADNLILSNGQAGSVVITAAGTFAARDGSVIGTFSQGFGGNAGNISLTVGDELRIESGSRLTTEARRADGGNVTIRVGNQALLDSASITTAVGSGLGTGGNIDLRAPTFVQRSATISANAFGGPGGNIGIGAQTIFISSDSRVTASSVLNVDGTITFESPALDPTGELLAPVPVFLDAGAVLAGRCGPRLAGRASSLVFIPRPVEGGYPDELRPVLDGRTTGFLTVPAPQQACLQELDARLAQVAR